MGRIWDKVCVGKRKHQDVRKEDPGVVQQPGNKIFFMTAGNSLFVAAGSPGRSAVLHTSNKSTENFQFGKPFECIFLRNRSR